MHFSSSSLFLISVFATVQNGRGCGYAEWHDAALPKFFRELIGDLRDEVWRLKGQGTVAPYEIQSAMLAPIEDQTTMEMMRPSLEDQLRVKDAEIASIKGKYRNVLVLFIVFVVGLIAGKM